MLIPSHRHTAADLRLWAELEAADHEHGRAASLSVKAARSIEAIQAFAAEGHCYASVSWGKDSVVLAHLVTLACPAMRIVHLRVEPTENPCTPDVRDYFLADHPAADYLELTKRSVHLFDDPLTRMQVKSKAFSRPFLDAGLPDRYISGVRAAESGNRRMRMRMHGTSTARTCAPVGWWSDADVFGYLATNNLPTHPNYAMTGGGRWERHRIRVSELAGEFGREFGRAEWEREYYGDVLAKLKVPR